MRVLAIIPARGGSKGVPGKNLIELGGKTLVQHAVDCALGAQLVDEVVVTSDSDDILNSIHSDKIRLIKRPAKLATDKSPVFTAIEHVLNQFLKFEFDIIVLLQPTAPLRTSKDLDKVIDLLVGSSETNGVISTVAIEDMHPARMYNLDDSMDLLPYRGNDESIRRQDLKPVYFRNGCFYAVRVKAFMEEKTFMVKAKKAYVMDSQWLANIDTPRDVIMLQVLYDLWKNQN